MGRRCAFGFVFFITQVCSLVYVKDGFAQLPEQSLQPGCYMVVAAYRPSRHSYARQYIQNLSEKGVSATIGLDKKRNYLYVYLGYYTDRGSSIADLYSVRHKAGFSKAWVRVIGGEIITGDHITASSMQNQKKAKNRFEKPPISDVVLKAKQKPANSSTVTGQFRNDLAEKVDHKKEQPTARGGEEVYRPDTVLIQLYQKESHKAVMGNVMVFDTDRSRRLGTLSSGVQAPLPDPANNSGMLTLEVSVFGYKLQQVHIPFRLTSSDTLKPFISRRGNSYLITFYLERYERGKLYTMDNVLFYNNAAIMLPESESQLNKLLEMMQESLSCVIRLHGHTNGRMAGKLITMGSENNFFTISGNVQEGFGSAHKLSRERALTIKKWLVWHGIVPNRIKTKAWGGRKMLYDQNRSTAYKNVRVEVEIMKQ